MNIQLGQILVAQLQKLGIFPDDYQRIAIPTYKALCEVEKDLKTGDTFIFPNGTTCKVEYKIGEDSEFK
jgi:hypothetical protein